MKYYNESEIPNHKEIKINYLNKNKRKKLHRSTDNIFETYKGYTLHTIYNNFLVNPYLVRNKKYQIALNNYPGKNQTYRYRYNNYNNIINDNENYMRQNSYRNENINYNENNKYENQGYDSFQNSMELPKINMYQNNIKNQKLIRKKIINEENKNNPNYKNNFQTISAEKKYIPQYPKIENIKDKIIIERPIEYNIKNKKEYNDSFYTNNNNKLYLSYDHNKKIKYLNKSMEYAENNNEYISPVVAKIAKHNYLMKNPYSDKNEYLGPSRLRNNPILYPISTYKFDFNRYIKNYHVNKFV